MTCMPLGYPAFFNTILTHGERAAGIRRARQELGRLRSELTLHRDSLTSRNDSLARDEIKRQAAPLNLLLLLHEQLVEEVSDLEHSLSNGKPLPYRFEFGRYIFGDEAAGEWYIGSQQQYEDWGKIQQFKARLDALRLQGQPMREQLGSLRGNLEALQEKHQTTSEED